MKKIAFLLSGNGGFAKFVYYNAHLLSNANMELIITDRECAAYRFFSESTIIPTSLINFNDFSNKDIFESELLECLLTNKIDYIFLNYNRLVSSKIISQFENRIFNLHLSILPLFKGFKATERAFQSDMLFFGSTLHIVDNSVDGGKILGQMVLGKKIFEEEECFLDRLYQSTRIFFLDMIYKISSIDIKYDYAREKYYFPSVKYGTLPFNPELSLDISKVINKH